MSYWLSEDPGELAAIAIREYRKILNRAQTIEQVNFSMANLAYRLAYLSYQRYRQHHPTSLRFLPADPGNSVNTLLDELMMAGAPVDILELQAVLGWPHQQLPQLAAPLMAKMQSAARGRILGHPEWMWKRPGFRGDKRAL
jgi:hypothetical protein